MNRAGLDILIGHTWAMERTHLEALKTKLAASDVSAMLGDAGGPDRAGLDVIDGVAHIPIHGVMLKAVPGYFRWLGIDATDTEETRILLAKAVADERVKSIRLDVDSPGGTIDGLQALVDDVYKAADTKKITAHAPDLAASAAYWVASQADKITAGAMAAIGGIGTYTIRRDTSKMAEELGVVVHVISSHELKGSAPGAPIPPSQLADAQREIDTYTDHFVNAVARGRGTDKASIQALATGQVWIGKDAKRKGLVDAITQDTIATVTDNPQPAPLGAITSTTEDPVMDPKAKEAELQARIAELESTNAVSTAAKAEADARADKATAEARTRLLAQYQDRVTPASKAGIDEYADFCGDDIDRLETHLRGLPAAANPDQIGASHPQGSVPVADAGETAVEAMLGLRPGTMAKMGDVESYCPGTKSFRRADGTYLRAEEVN